MLISEEQYLEHYGILRRSGRYPWGSGVDEPEHNRLFLNMISDLKKKGMSETDIAKGFGLSTTQLRAQKTIAKNQQQQAEIDTAQRYRNKGMSNVAIGQRLGRNESYVRSLLAPGAKDKADVLLSTANMLKNQVDEKKFVDVGSGVETHIGISATKLGAALAILKEQGYEVHSVKGPQVATGQYTNYKILATPGTTQKEAWQNLANIKQVYNFSDDGGRTFYGIHFPMGIDSSRVAVKYGSEGGKNADGVIFVRPGVKDVSLGSARYAQVRVMVDGTHYLKGMAMYKDGLPPGVDLQFNTNKEDTGNKLDAMKKLETDDQGKVDPNNPFGSQIARQLVEKDDKGNEHLTSVMNIVNEEGNWKDWSKNLSSQMLSKQSPSLIRSQLAMTYEQRLKEFNRLSELTNPAVRKKLLESFGDETSKAAVHLKAAAINTRQATHVILPMDSLKETEVYAPNFHNGEQVVLIRHPHGGTFEIPELTVNNNNPEAKKLLGDARDAIGIHHAVAERLSGADFDGDAVIVIPNGSRKVKSTPALEGLKDFDPKASFPKYPGMPVMTSRQKGQEMGSISNLITDMTIMGATRSELTRAIKHSMVVIDAEKHELNYKESARVNGIAQLNKKYRGNARAGASTLISRAGAEVRIPERVARPARDGGPIDKATGKRVYVETGRTIPGKDGTPKPIQIKSKALAETEDAHTLSSGLPQERLYADHSNKLKALGDAARKEAVNTPPAKYSPSARKTYAAEVSSLNSKLQLVYRNRPQERQAQLIAGAVIKQVREANPNMDDETEKKVKYQALSAARARMNARGTEITITPKEWEAIQAGAISTTKLNEILNKADLDVVRKLATPKRAVKMTPAKTTRAQQMLASGYTRAEVASALGVSLTTLDEATHGKESNG